jgi:AraC-like DNA-binding protein
LTDKHVALEDLWGPSASELRERLCAAATPEERFLLMEATLAARFRCGWDNHAAVSIALGVFEKSGFRRSVQSVAECVGLSRRRFIEVFTAQVGLTPKLFCRVLRFQQARALAGPLAKPDWANVALHCGYFDQSHLIRDFSHFSGMRPTDYVRLRSDRVLGNHVPVGVE